MMLVYLAWFTGDGWVGVRVGVSCYSDGSFVDKNAILSPSFTSWLL